jgi:hypothetical protein
MLILCGLHEIATHKQWKCGKAQQYTLENVSILQNRL